MADARLGALVGRPSSTGEGGRAPTRGTTTSAGSLGFTDPYNDNSRPVTTGSSDESAGGLGSGSAGGTLPPSISVFLQEGGGDAESLGLSPEEAQQLYQAFCLVEGGATGYIPAEPVALGAVLEALSVQGDLSDLRDMLAHLVEDTQGVSSAAPQGCISFTAFARAMISLKDGGGW